MKTEATDGYSAVQVGYNQTNVPGKVNKPELGHLAKSGAPQLRTLQEFRVRARAVCRTTAPAAPAAPRQQRARDLLRMARVARFSGLHAALHCGAAGGAALACAPSLRPATLRGAD